MFLLFIIVVAGIYPPCPCRKTFVTVASRVLKLAVPSLVGKMPFVVVLRGIK
jgi:hypothetical protein